MDRNTGIGQVFKEAHTVLGGFYGGADVYEGRHECHGGLRHDLATYKKIDGFARGPQLLATAV